MTTQVQIVRENERDGQKLYAVLDMRNASFSANRYDDDPSWNNGDIINGVFAWQMDPKLDMDTVYSLLYTLLPKARCMYNNTVKYEDGWFSLTNMSHAMYLEISNATYNISEF